ncbi:MAG: 2-phosphosulfolactate phosphatase [Dermatophilaceae bacterium]
MATPWDQAPHGIRVDWGSRGAHELVAGGVAHVVVVDVLSFTTSVGVAVSRGMTVRPHPWHDRSGHELAARSGAVCAVGRAVAGPGDVSLSPASIAAAQGISRLVLPSPNGSAICSALADAGVEVVTASLRNAPAAGRWLAARLGASGIVAAGERWRDDGSLRPAIEDLWGAGAVVDALLVHRPDAGPSPEAAVALAAWHAASGVLAHQLGTCASGIELRERGFGDDVAVAADHGADDVVPVLVDGWFVAAPG